MRKMDYGISQDQCQYFLEKLSAAQECGVKMQQAGEKMQQAGEKPPIEQREEGNSGPCVCLALAVMQEDNRFLADMMLTKFGPSNFCLTGHERKRLRECYRRAFAKGGMA